MRSFVWQVRKSLQGTGQSVTTQVAHSKQRINKQFNEKLCLAIQKVIARDRSLKAWDLSKPFQKLPAGQLPTGSPWLLFPTPNCTRTLSHATAPKEERDWCAFDAFGSACDAPQGKIHSVLKANWQGGVHQKDHFHFSHSSHLRTCRTSVFFDGGNILWNWLESDMDKSIHVDLDDKKDIST